MKKFYILLSFIVSLILNPFITNAQCGTNLLNNPGFDAPIQASIGNNLLGVFTFSGGWTMTGGPFNVIRTDGTSYSGGPDTARNGTQYVDITSNAGTLYQDFTIGGAGAPVVFGGYFSSRETGGYQNWIASIDIVALPSLTVVATSDTRTFTIADGTSTAQEVWYLIKGNTILSPGNYRYIVNMGNYANFDAAFLFQNCTVASKLLYFGGSYGNNAVTLNWKFENQDNLLNFEVEKSLDGATFKSVNTVYAANTLLYNYKDLNINTNGVLFYRLKMVDKNGKITYSNIVKVVISPTSRVFILGNPIKNDLVIGGVSIGAVATLYDNTGKQVLQKNIQDSFVTIDVSFLPSGVYFLQYYKDGVVENRKVVKQ
jgi:hypothetical protein